MNKLRLHFEYGVSPLSVHQDDSWEVIQCITDIHAEQMFEDIELQKLASLILIEIAPKTWIIGPYWHPELGLRRPISVLPEFKLADELRIKLLRLNDCFQKTFDDDYPPNSGFSSQNELSAFETETMDLVNLIRNGLSEDFELEYMPA